MRAGPTGVLDYCFEKYLKEVEPLGISYEDWVRSPAYDPVAIKQEFKAHALARLAADKAVLARVLTGRPDRRETHARAARHMGARPLALRPPHRT